MTDFERPEPQREEEKSVSRAIASRHQRCQEDGRAKVGKLYRRGMPIHNRTKSVMAEVFCNIQKDRFKQSWYVFSQRHSGQVKQ